MFERILDAVFLWATMSMTGMAAGLGLTLLWANLFSPPPIINLFNTVIFLLAGMLAFPTIVTRLWWDRKGRHGVSLF